MGWRLFDPNIQKAFFTALYDNKVTSFKDELGRTVYYGTNDNDEVNLNRIKMKDLDLFEKLIYHVNYLIYDKII